MKTIIITEKQFKTLFEKATDVLPKLGWINTPKGIIDINKPKNKKISKYGSYISGDDRYIKYPSI